MAMRTFGIIFLIMIVFALNTVAYGLGGFIPLPPIGMEWTPPIPPHGFWFKPGSDREQLTQDYSQCRGKGERLCMREKGYFWLSSFTGFWYKIGTTQQQVVQDYSECRNTKHQISCMKEKGYTWASYYGEL